MKKIEQDFSSQVIKLVALMDPQQTEMKASSREDSFNLDKHREELVQVETKLNGFFVERKEIKTQLKSAMTDNSILKQKVYLTIANLQFFSHYKLPCN